MPAWLRPLVALIALLPAWVAASRAGEPPRLVLQITVDGLRGDLLQRYNRVLGAGGFRYLLDHGIHYTHAHYRHANTKTVVGHATLATGTVPADHGMVANVWYDRGLERLVYNIEDPRYPLLGERPGKAHGGRSPNNILTSTLSDEIAIHFAGRAKLFSVAVKDRSAVVMAGHAGKAFWFSRQSAGFISSEYYYREYPGWVKAWNARHPARAYAGRSWQLLHPRSRYLFGDADDNSYEIDHAGFGRSFPHPYGKADDRHFVTRLLQGPAADELTLDFVKALVTHEELGQDAVPDYLAIGFSATDYVGHLFGASSLESEDILARLDRTLAALFSWIDERIGLEHTLIVLSSDHGQPEAPGYLHRLGISKAHYFDDDSLSRGPVIEALKQRYGPGEELIEAWRHPYIYLDHDLIRERGLELAEVENTLAAALTGLDDVAVAVSSTALNTGRLPDIPLMRLILNNYHPARSGDIYVVLKPDVFINKSGRLTMASSHGSPWRYDTFVPVIFAGSGLKGRTVSRPVAPRDIAPTLAVLLGVKPPSGATGTPLAEVLE